MTKNLQSSHQVLDRQIVKKLYVKVISLLIYYDFFDYII